MSEIQKYSGMWKFFEDETPYQGELHINTDDNVIVLNTIIPANEQIPMPRPPYKGKIPYIYGKLFSGTKVLLYNCFTGQETTRVGSHTQQIVYADYAFWGLEVSSEDEIRFPCAILDYGDIIEWSGLCNYEWDYNNGGWHNIIWKPKESLYFDFNDNLRVMLSPSQGKTTGGRYDNEITIRQHISVEFNYSSPVTWEQIMLDSLCLQYLIGLGINRKVEIAHAEYLHSSIFFEYPEEDGRTGHQTIPADVIIGTGKVPSTRKTPSYYFLFSLNDLVQQNVFQRWQQNYEKLKPILDLYFTAFSNNVGTVEMLFLNLTQALETYHARFKTDNVKEFINYIDNILSIFSENEDTKAYWRRFLIDQSQLNHQNHIHLRSRLADLVFADGVLPFWPRLYGLGDYIRKVVDTRNYYTHYDTQKLEKSFTKAELPFVNSQLICLLTYHILVQIGFNPTEIRKKIVERMNDIHVSYQIQSETHRIESHHQNAAPEDET